MLEKVGIDKALGSLMERTVDSDNVALLINKHCDDTNEDRVNVPARRKSAWVESVRKSNYELPVIPDLEIFNSACLDSLGSSCAVRCVRKVHGDIKLSVPSGRGA